MKETVMKETPEYPVLGTYKHFRGGLYAVSGLGTHTETGDKFVIYTNHPVKDGAEQYIRPLDMFNMRVEWMGKLVRRFALVEETN